MRWSGVEDILLNGNILIIELVNKSERSNALSIGAETGFSELLSDGLEAVRTDTDTEIGLTLRI